MALLRKVFGFDLIRSGHPEVVKGCRRRANRETSAQSLRISASFLLRLQSLICCSHANASSLVGNSSENTTLREPCRGVAFNLTRLMLGYPIFKVIGMSSVVRVISTPQYVNPETHLLLLLALQTSYHLLVDRPEPFDQAQGERSRHEPFMVRFSNHER